MVPHGHGLYPNTAPATFARAFEITSAIGDQNGKPTRPDDASNNEQHYRIREEGDWQPQAPSEQPQAQKLAARCSFIAEQGRKVLLVVWKMKRR